jgi:hypothetical protein
MKPFITYNVERYNGSALVRVVRVSERQDGSLKSETLSEYETLSNGATASAKREMKKFSAEQVSA